MIVNNIIKTLRTLRTFFDESLEPTHIRPGPAIDTIDFRCLFTVT